VRCYTSGGCEALTFNRYSKALAYAKAHSQNKAPHGLLLDYQLGDGDGLQLAQELRDIWQQQIPAALVTAMRDDAVKQAARKKRPAVFT
jgi:Response regulator receiver domain.